MNNRIIENMRYFAKITPEKAAILYEEIKMNYFDLYLRITKYADELIKLGIKENNKVIVQCEGTIDDLLIILAILKLNCCFIPIEKNISKEKLVNIINSSKCSKLIMLREYIFYDFKDDYMQCNLYSFTNRKIWIRKTISEIKENTRKLMYILYTSGTTGVPKGVMISEDNFIAFIESIEELVDYKKRDIVFLGITSFTFDISMLESLGTLYHGGTYAMIGDKYKLNCRYIENFMMNHKVNVVQITPTNLRFYLKNMMNLSKAFNNVERLLIGGENFPVDVIEDLRKLCNADIYNCYGPTETTIWISYKKIENDVTLGKVIGKNRIFLDFLDNSSIGEIVIEGLSVSEGYIGESIENNKKFYNISKYRGFRTGDFGKYNEYGEIVFLGRRDRQIKINGYRIELDEIEFQINRLEYINLSAVLQIKKNNKAKLVCCYESEKELDVTMIYSYLTTVLPAYAIPSLFVFVEKIPVNLSLKIDYKQLERMVHGII